MLEIGINLAVKTHEVKRAMIPALKKFNHRDKYKHNLELENGAATALYQKLVIALASCERGEDAYVEIGMVCSALEMVYRCSSSAREKSFNEIGDELVRVYLRVIENCETVHAENGKDVITKILLVFQYFARVKKISIPFMNIPGTLNVLALVVSSNYLHNAARATAMNTLADLACAEANGEAMARVPLLFDSVVDVAYRDVSTETREAAARAIQNIVFSIDNRLSTTAFERLVKVLIHMLKAKNLNIIKYASGALQNVTTWEGCQIKLLEYKGGVAIDALIKAISNLTEETNEIRVRSLGIIINLTCEKTASSLCTHKNLLRTLANAASFEINETAKKNASDALFWLAEDLKSNSVGQKQLLDYIVKVAENGNTSFFSKAIYEMSQHHSNRMIIAQHPRVVSLLEKLSNKNNSDTDTVGKDYSIKALSNLARR